MFSLAIHSNFVIGGGVCWMIVGDKARNINCTSTQLERMYGGVQSWALFYDEHDTKTARIESVSMCCVCVCLYLVPCAVLCRVYSTYFLVNACYKCSKYDTPTYACSLFTRRRRRRRHSIIGCGMRLCSAFTRHIFYHI